MLAELSIKNFAIIETISISFEKGLTVLTGETGAGKSIIIDAIGLLVGGRGSSEFVRHGEEKAEIEGLFLLDEINHPCIKKCEEFGIDVSDSMVVLRRVIAVNGKSSCRVNGKLVTISILREIGQTLIDIHGQHEHQDLMNEDRHIAFLDQFAHAEIKESLIEYTNVYKTFQKFSQKLAQLNENEQQMAHRLDLITFQLEEIKRANLEPGEDDKLLEEKLQLSNYEKIFSAVQDAYSALAGEQKGLDWLGHALSHLDSVASINPLLKQLHEAISNSFYVIEETTFSLRKQLDDLEFEPERLNIIEERWNEITFLKKKYGNTVEEILNYAAKIEDEIDTIQNREFHIENLQKELEQAKQDVLVEAIQLSDCRKRAAVLLTEAIQKEFKELYMDKAKFDIDIQNIEGRETDPIYEGKFTRLFKNGMDVVQFLICTNPGEPLKPLSKVASGGELSRIMLALKSIFSEHQGITSIIFDEVDTGVSGRVAQAIAEKISKISTNSQVLCITHLPQVAAMADQHLFISKQISDTRTITSVSSLKGEEQVREIARMISGVEMTDLTFEHAKELLQQANNKKVSNR